MNDERTRLIFGLASCVLAGAYYGIGLWFYTKGYADAGIEQANAHAHTGQESA